MKNVSQHLPKQHGTKIAWDYSMLPYTFSKIEITEVISARLANICRVFLWKQFQQYSSFDEVGKRSTKPAKSKEDKMQKVFYSSGFFLKNKIFYFKIWKPVGHTSHPRTLIGPCKLRWPGFSFSVCNLNILVPIPISSWDVFPCDHHKQHHGSAKEQQHFYLKGSTKIWFSTQEKTKKLKIINFTVKAPYLDYFMPTHFVSTIGQLRARGRTATVQKQLWTWGFTLGCWAECYGRIPSRVNCQEAS